MAAVGARLQRFTRLSNCRLVQSAAVVELGGPGAHLRTIYEDLRSARRTIHPCDVATGPPVKEMSKEAAAAVLDATGAHSRPVVDTNAVPWRS